MKKQLFKHKVQLTKANYNTLVKGKPIRLKAHQLGTGEHEIVLHSKRKSNKLHKCGACNKGAQISLSEHELKDTMEGGSMRSFRKWYHTKASPWLRRAGHDLWRAIRKSSQDSREIGKYGAYTAIDTAHDVAPTAVQGAIDVYNPMGAVSRNVGKTVVGVANAALAPAPTYVVDGTKVDIPGVDGTGIQQAYPQPLYMLQMRSLQHQLLLRLRFQMS
jgi:hypothetical protein